MNECTQLAYDMEHDCSECAPCQKWLASIPPAPKKICTWKLKNGWEHVPEKDGIYFIVDHCNRKRVYNYCASSGGWWNDQMQEPYCPTCTRFQWLDISWVRESQ